MDGWMDGWMDGCKMAAIESSYFIEDEPLKTKRELNEMNALKWRGMATQ